VAWTVATAACAGDITAVLAPQKVNTFTAPAALALSDARTALEGNGHLYLRMSCRLLRPPDYWEPTTVSHPIPAGVTSLDFVIQGGRSAAHWPGGRASGRLTVIPGEPLFIDFSYDQNYNWQPNVAVRHGAAWLGAKGGQDGLGNGWGYCGTVTSCVTESGVNTGVAQVHISHTAP
jgi:hypothetical protein